MSGSSLGSPTARRVAPLTQHLSPFPGDTDSLAGKLAGEMARRWHEGEQPLAEEYLSQHPELCGQPDAVVRLIYEEICLRQERGQETASMEVVQRFPQWREQLEDILCHPFPKRLQMPRMPEVGEALGGFRLLAALGQGIRGKVFLASQPAQRRIEQRDGHVAPDTERLWHDNGDPGHVTTRERGVEALRQREPQIGIIGFHPSARLIGI